MEPATLFAETGQFFANPMQMWCLIGFGAVVAAGLIYTQYQKVKDRSANPPAERSQLTIASVVAGWLISMLVASYKIARIDGGKYSIYIVLVVAVTAVGIAISIYALQRKKA